MSLARPEHPATRPHHDVVLDIWDTEAILRSRNKVSLIVSLVQMTCGSRSSCCQGKVPLLPVAAGTSWHAGIAAWLVRNNCHRNFKLAVDFTSDASDASGRTLAQSTYASLSTSLQLDRPMHQLVAVLDMRCRTKHAQP